MSAQRRLSKRLSEDISTHRSPSAMTKGNGYVRVWNEDASLSKQRGDETRRPLTECAKIEPEEEK